MSALASHETCEYAAARALVHSGNSALIVRLLTAADAVAELVAELRQMHAEEAIDLAQWPAARRLVDGAECGAL